MVYIIKIMVIGLIGIEIGMVMEEIINYEKGEEIEDYMKVEEGGGFLKGEMEIEEILGIVKKIELEIIKMGSERDINEKEMFREKGGEKRGRKEILYMGIEIMMIEELEGIEIYVEYERNIEEILIV